jgi:ribose-phosphate pyrophosphokinase
MILPANLDESYILVDNISELALFPVTFSEFPDGDTHCLIKNVADIRDKQVLIMHSLYPEQNKQIFKLLLLLDFLRSIGAQSVSVFSPYMPYTRQDKRHVPGEAISIDTLCRVLADVGCSRFYTFDCHFLKGVPEAVHQGLSIYNISLGERLLGHHKITSEHKSFDIIGPDDGSAYLVRGSGTQNMHKVRGEYAKSGDGKVSRAVEKMDDSHIQLGEKAVVIMDDMISTGGTLLKAIEALRNRGIEHIYCVASHGLFLKGSYDKLLPLIDGIIVSDSIAHDASVPITAAVLSDEIIPHWRKHQKSLA